MGGISRVFNVGTTIAARLHLQESLLIGRRACFGAVFFRTACSCLNSLQRLSWKRINFQSSQDWVKHTSSRTVILGPKEER